MLYTFGHSLSAKLNAIPINDEIRVALYEQRVRLGGMEVPQSLEAATHKAVEDAVSASFISGFRVVMMVSVALSVSSAVSAWLLIGRLARGVRRNKETL
jgi:hypothetical protein